MILKTIVLLLVIAASLDVSRSEKRVFRRSSVGPVWPTKKIAYAFSNILEFDFEARLLIEKAIKMFETSLAINGDSCIDFVPRRNETDYILFVDGGDCSSG